MAQFPIDLNATLREEPDKSFTIVVEISGIPTTQAAARVSNWLRQAIHDNVDMIGEFDKPPTRQ
jgi:hypothetical protein